MVANEIWVHPRSFISIPREYILVFFRNSISSSLSWGGNWEPTWKNYFGSSPTATFSRSSYFTSSVDSLLDSIGVLDYYKFFSAEAEDSALGLYKMAATMHCLAMDWFPTISLTWLLDVLGTYFYVIGISFDKMHFTCIWINLSRFKMIITSG